MSDDVNDAEAGQGESAGNSSSQENMVPLTALQAERGHRQTLERDLAELRGTVNTLKETQAQPKEHSRADLQARVDAGQISQEGADRILEDQQAARIETKVATSVQTTLNEQDRVRKITAEIERYREFRPDIMEDGSESRLLVAAEYNRQVSEHGKPQNMQTELDALSATFGPASKLQKGRQSEAETHQDVGSDGGEGHEPVGKVPKGLNKEATAYYGKQIEQGVHKDWDSVKKMLDRASPNSRRRLGLA